jgi:hypothetical protein
MHHILDKLGLSVFQNSSTHALLVAHWLVPSFFKQAHLLFDICHLGYFIDFHIYHFEAKLTQLHCTIASMLI